MDRHPEQQPALSRRGFIKAVGGAGAGFALFRYLPGSSVAAFATPIPGGSSIRQRCRSSSRRC